MNILLDRPFRMKRYQIIQMRVRAYNANGGGPWAYSTNTLGTSALKLDLPPRMKVRVQVGARNEITLKWKSTLDPTSTTAFYEILGKKSNQEKYEVLAKLAPYIVSYKLGGGPRWYEVQIRAVSGTGIANAFVKPEQQITKLMLASRTARSQILLSFWFSLIFVVFVGVVVCCFFSKTKSDKKGWGNL